MRDTNDGRQRGKPRGIRRDRDCRSCKLRNIKCDLNRPRCLPCVRAGLSCGGYPQRVVWAGVKVADDATVKRRLQDPCITVIQTPMPVSPERSDMPARHPPQRHDRHRFIDRLAEFCHQIKTVDECDPRRSLRLSDKAFRLVSYLDDFLQARITLYATAVLDAEETADSVEAAHRRLAVLVHLNEALETADPFAILGIAAFALLEVYDGPWGDWQRHIHGAKSLLDCHCRTRSDLDDLAQNVPGLMEVVARLVWFDTMSVVARGSPGLVFDDWHRQVSADAYYEGMGCPADTFDLLTRVTKGEVALDPLGSCFRAMDQLLKLAGGGSDRDQCVNVWRCAAAIAVLSRVDDGAAEVPRQATLLSATDRLCHAIASIPCSSPFHVHIAVPAYLAGINATKEQHCDVIRGYWQRCERAGTPRYHDALARCTEIWEDNGLENRTRAVESRAS